MLGPSLRIKKKIEHPPGVFLLILSLFGSLGPHETNTWVKIVRILRTTFQRKLASKCKVKVGYFNRPFKCLNLKMV